MRAREKLRDDRELERDSVPRPGPPVACEGTAEQLLSLQRSAGNAAVSHVLARARVQRMKVQVGNANLADLAALNLALPRVPNLQLGGLALPLTVASFNAGATLPRINSAIGQSNLELYEWMSLQDVVNESTTSWRLPSRPPPPTTTTTATSISEAVRPSRGAERNGHWIGPRRCATCSRPSAGSSLLCERMGTR